MSRKKACQFVFRTSEQDAASIRQKIADSGQSQQDYLTHAALNATIVNRNTLQKLLVEYKRHGNNLNQIARQLNAAGHLDVSAEQLMRDMHEERRQIWQLLKQSTQELT